MDSTTPVIVDTDVISFIFKDHQLAPVYQAILAGRSLTVSLITLAEIEYGMEAKNWGARRRELMGRFLSRFKPLLPDIDTANQWAPIKSGCEKKGSARFKLSSEIGGMTREGSLQICSITVYSVRIPRR